MKVRYKKLWHILIDRKMLKKDLEEAAHITHYQMYKLANGQHITTDVIGAICQALDVTPNDIIEFLPGESRQSAYRCKNGKSASRPDEP